jgi:hypothetical protein
MGTNGEIKFSRRAAVTLVTRRKASHCLRLKLLAHGLRDLML